MKMWNRCLVATSRKESQGGDKAFLVAKGCDKSVCKLLGDVMVVLERWNRLCFSCWTSRSYFHGSSQRLSCHPGRSSFHWNVKGLSDKHFFRLAMWKIVPAFLKELIYKVLGLQVSLLELDQFGILLGERRKGQITSSGRLFVSTVLGQMAHLVISITLNSARSCVMQSAFLTQGTVSNIPIVFSWSDSIRPEGFLSSVLLWLVIIVAVVGVGVTVVVVVVESSFVVKLSFVIT
ncbi:hypothetical protein Tco_1064480 [Tanacetum coccineum]